ncbi:MAG: class A beta-lactamase-related serine hydrolase [Actinomycetota bacterium]|nr:class A beta-lactamase-related serine hydrolase [Actinomycetota bacterium]
MRRLLIAAVVAVGLGATGSSASAAEAPALDWRPDVESATAYARTRRGSISFAVRTGGRLYGHRTTRTVPAASVLKAMLMVAYLNHPSVRDRALRRADMELLRPMITRSDNATATRIRDLVGNWRLRRLAKRVGMTRFRTAAIWGHSRIDASGQALFFERIDLFVPERHRERALSLLESIVPSQRWGIGRAAPEGWRLYFKGGWGSGTGAVDHQVALLRRGEHRVAVAIMTTGNGTHSYGKETLRGVAKRLLRGLAEAGASTAAG